MTSPRAPKGKRRKIDLRKLRAACVEVERYARQVGTDCEVVFYDRGVMVAPLGWPGDVTGRDLYQALRDAHRESRANR